MAIFIISNLTSNKFYPSQNPINATVNSNNSGKCSFRFICDVYLNGTKVFTEKLFPDPVTGYGFFQVSRVCQDYIKTLISKSPVSAAISVAGSTTTPASAFSLQLKFGEEYDSSLTCDGTINQYTNLATSNTAYVFESAIGYEDFPTFNYTDYLVGTQSASTKFLTNSQREIEVTYNDSYSLDFISLQTINSNFKRIVKTYDSSNTLLQTVTASNSPSTTRRYRVHCGPYDINTLASSTVISQNVDRYEVYLTYNNTKITETFTFKVKDPKAFRTRIAFVGLLGGIEHFTFYHRKRTSYNIERKTYSKTLQSNYSGQWKYEVGDRGDSVFGISAKEQNQVSSYCDVATSEWLYEMWLSPSVWTYRGADLKTFRTIVDGPDLKLWVDGEHGLVQDDFVYIYSDNNSISGYYQVLYVDGNIITTDGGWSTSISGCGWLNKEENWQILPVVISDNTVEVKEKLGRPIEYTLNYAAAYTKTTLNT